MVQLGLTDYFKRQVLQWCRDTVHMKEPSGLLGKAKLNKREMREVIMQTEEPDSTREATEIFVKILDNTYEKSYLNQLAANTTRMNDEERTLLLRLLKDSEDSFGGTLGDWDTETVDLHLKPGYIPFNSKYYLVPIINKETFRKYLKHLV